MGVYILVDRFDQASATRMNTFTLCRNCNLLRYRSCSCALCSLPVPLAFHSYLRTWAMVLLVGLPTRTTCIPLHSTANILLSGTALACLGLSQSHQLPAFIHKRETVLRREREGRGRGGGEGGGGEGERSSLTNTSAGIVSLVWMLPLKGRD